MKFLLDKADRNTIKSWIAEDHAENTLDPLRELKHFIYYLNNSFLTVESSSFRGEYEYWRDENPFND